MTACCGSLRRSRQDNIPQIRLFGRYFPSERAEIRPGGRYSTPSAGFLPQGAERCAHLHGFRIPSRRMMPTPAEVRPVIIGAMLAMFLAALDQTIVATALPSIAENLGGFALISWIVTSYLLTSVCVTPVFGKLSDMFGRRAMLVF